MTVRNPAQPPWHIVPPSGGSPATLDNLRAGINASGEYEVTAAAPHWSVVRRHEPPEFLRQLQVRRTAAGLVGGSLQELRDAIAPWPPGISVGTPQEREAFLSELDGRAKPTGPIEAGEAFRLADTALRCADKDDLPETAMRVAAALLRWYPNGQMLFWAKNYGYVRDTRPAHLLAAAALQDLDEVERSVAASRDGLWFHGENIVFSHPGSLYLNLVNGIHSPGLAFETLPVTFIFEFGLYQSVIPSLDFLSIRYLHSLPVLEYLPPNLEAEVPIVTPGLLQQDALREWFVEGYNRLATHLARWENFMTTGGELRLVSLQDTNMTIGRILSVTAHLLASGERAARLADFWDLVDLYANFFGKDIIRMFGCRFYVLTILGALRTLPGELAQLFEENAKSLYAEWLTQTVGGVVDPARVAPTSVTVGFGSTQRRLSLADFFARHVAERRNTLHGYALADKQAREFIAIHTGALPQRLAEWGRLMFLLLLAKPEGVIERRFLT